MMDIAARAAEIRQASAARRAAAQAAAEAARVEKARAENLDALRQQRQAAYDYHYEMVKIYLATMKDADRANVNAAYRVYAEIDRWIAFVERVQA